MILALTFKMTINFSSKTSLIPGHSKHTLRLWLRCSTFPSTPTSVITTIHHVTFHQNSSNKRGIIEPLLIKALGQIWFWRCSVLRLQVCASRCHPPWSEWDSYWTPPCRCSGDIRWRYDMAWKTWQLKLRCRALYRFQCLFLQQELSLVKFATFCPFLVKTGGLFTAADSNHFKTLISLVFTDFILFQGKDGFRTFLQKKFGRCTWTSCLESGACSEIQFRSFFTLRKKNQKKRSLNVSECLLSQCSERIEVAEVSHLRSILKGWRAIDSAGFLVLCSWPQQSRSIL